MHYRSIDDLNRIIVENIYRIPHDIDLIVGVPRSGMLVASMVALHSNRQLTDVEGYTHNRIMSTGLQRAKIGKKVNSVAESRRALVIDDSLLTGTEMKRVRGLIDAAGLTDRTMFATVLCNPEQENEIDLAFELCPTPRVFEWNLMHGHMLPKSCVDIDGVLCLDPSKEQNDDGPKYHEFLRTARSLWRPTATIGILVTSRLEKYRDLTEAWLAEQGIKYNKLEMMQYNTMLERQQAKAYGSFKAAIYAQSDMIFFIESSEVTTAEIARLSGKPALCIESHRLYDPSGVPHVRQRAKKAIQGARSLIQRVKNKLKKLLTLSR